MATLDYTGAASGALPSHLDYGKVVRFKKRMNTVDIIASDATMTANAKITSGDIVQAIQVPAGFVFLGSAIKSVTPEGAADTVDIGIAGGDEIQDGATSNGAAGTATLTLVGDDWGGTLLMGYYFSAADTIDVTYKADHTVADFILYVWGIMLD